MSDEFGQLLSEQKEVAISQGAVVSGQVIAVKEDEIVLNIGYKADAVISRNEFTNIPNANLCDLVKVGDVVEIKEKCKGSQRYKDILEVTGGRLVPEWIEADQEALKGTIKEYPTREMIDVPVNEVLIVELYSK